MTFSRGLLCSTVFVERGLVAVYEVKGIVQPFELGGETTLIRSTVIYWKAGMFFKKILMIPSHERSIKPFSGA
jgi:hypothetical protein